MVVMILEKVPVALRGELTRWLVEIKHGVYVGHVSAMVRDKLWEKCASGKLNGGVFQAWSTNNEQHFTMRLAGIPERILIDWEGLQLIKEVCKPLSPVQVRRISEGH